MANEEHLQILRQGVGVWNNWRHDNPSVNIDFIGEDLTRVNLTEVNLRDANLRAVDFTESNLTRAKLTEADLTRATFTRANLRGVDLSKAELDGANFAEANLMNSNLTESILTRADLSKAELGGADFIGAILRGADLSEADLSGAGLTKANLRGTNFTGAILRGTDLSEADFTRATFRGADLRNADFTGANLTEVDLRDADLSEADLTRAILIWANLTGANLTGATLNTAVLVGTRLYDADLSDCRVFGISAWKLSLGGTIQSNLIITDYGEPIVTVDNLEVAQFVYLLLHNEKLRDVINTIANKAVLILGRFTLPERKEILDGLRDTLRAKGFVPIVFDFEKATERDFTETIKVLVGMSLFVIADITNPKSTPLELQATVPDYMIPFVPIIQKGENPFAMFLDLQQKYHWVLEARQYENRDQLIDLLEVFIIKPALDKHNELMKLKNAQLRMIDLADFAPQQ